MINCFGCGVDWLGDYGHTAEDFANGREGDAVYSVSTGVVLWRGVGPNAYGNVVIVQYNVRGDLDLRPLCPSAGRLCGSRAGCGPQAADRDSGPVRHLSCPICISRFALSRTIAPRGYTFFPFTGVSIDYYGMTFYAPSWYIETHRQLPAFYLIADASNPTGVYFVEGGIKRAVPAEVYNSWGLAAYPIDYIDHQRFESYPTAANLSKLVSANGGVYFVDRGGKKAIPDVNTFNIWGFDWSSVVEVSPATLGNLPSSSNLSYLVQPEGSGSVYLVDNKTRHPLLSGDLLQHFGYPAQRDVSVISGDFPLSDAAPISGFTVKGSGAEKYVMNEGRKMLIPNDNIMNLWNLGGASFASLSDATISNIYSGPDLSSLGQTYGSGGVYLLEGGAKRPIVDYDTFSNWGFDPGAIFKVGSAVSGAYSDGAPLTRLISYSGQTYLAQNGARRQLTNFASLDAESLWHYGLLASDLQSASSLEL